MKKTAFFSLLLSFLLFSPGASGQDPVSLTGPGSGVEIMEYRIVAPESDADWDSYRSNLGSPLRYDAVSVVQKGDVVYFVTGTVTNKSSKVKSFFLELTSGFYRVNTGVFLGISASTTDKVDNFYERLLIDYLAPDEIRPFTIMIETGRTTLSRASKIALIGVMDNYQLGNLEFKASELTEGFNLSEYNKEKDWREAMKKGAKTVSYETNIYGGDVQLYSSDGYTNINAKYAEKQAQRQGQLDQLEEPYSVRPRELGQAFDPSSAVSAYEVTCLLDGESISFFVNKDGKYYNPGIFFDDKYDDYDDAVMASLYHLNCVK